MDLYLSDSSKDLGRLKKLSTCNEIIFEVLEIKFMCLYKHNRLTDENFERQLLLRANKLVD
jgi:hypothetical protein